MKAITYAFGFFIILLVILPVCAVANEPSKSSAQAIEEPVGTITLREVVALALLKNPELQAFDQEIRVREAITIQAGLLPNPELEASNENFAGQRAFSGFQQSQTTIALSQVILLGGKRANRTRVASFSKDLAQWDYETKRMDVLTQVAQTFADVLGSQQQLELIQDLMRLAERVHLTVSERVKAGKVSAIEETRAQVALSSTRIELQRAQNELKAARKRLASLWGSTTPIFKAVHGDLSSIAPLPSLETLDQRVSRNPDLARWATEIAQRQAAVDNEKAKAIPNITLSGGYQRLGQTNDNAFIVGLSFPLMIFNRNQGGIQKAFSRVSKAEKNQRATKVRVTTALSQAYQILAFAYSQAVILRDEVLPGAKSAFDAINEGYLFGKFPFLNVLDNQRTFFQARAQYVRTLTDYHKAVASVERLIGGKLNPDSVTETKQ